jgi:predicted pyridoxine 5'-phosphate oxidase superfamily flavin-nucleotide-binding protein
MSDLYGARQRAFQREFDSERLAQRMIDAIVTPELPDAARAFIESRDMFFLSTVDHRGFPTCSYKGGAPGFVKVLDGRHLAFPSYDGNGMFLSVGNIAENGKVGMLFIDFETPHRIRVQGTARIDRSDELMKLYPGADVAVRVEIEETFQNCPRYIHRHRRVESSQYVPGEEGKAPAPQWKRIDLIQDALPERHRHVAQEMGGVIDIPRYEALLKEGKA